MRNQYILLPVVVFLFSSLAAAQGVYTPEKGSAERTAILDTLRVPVEKAFKQKIVFVTDNCKVQGTWAFVSGQPMLPSGQEPELKNTRFAAYQDAYDNNFFGLLRKTAGKWKVVTHAIGCTDVCYADWWKRYRAPKAIFPYTE